MTLKKGQILDLFYFFLKFSLACRKIEASQGFWYQGVGADMLFRNLPPPDLHNNRCPCYCPFSLNFMVVFPPKLGPPWKNYIFGILVKRAILTSLVSKLAGGKMTPLLVLNVTKKHLSPLRVKVLEP